MTEGRKAISAAEMATNKYRVVAGVRRSRANIVMLSMLVASPMTDVGRQTHILRTYRWVIRTCFREGPSCHGSSSMQSVVEFIFSTVIAMESGLMF